jgi:subtilase family serine protease
LWHGVSLAQQSNAGTSAQISLPHGTVVVPESSIPKPQPAASFQNLHARAFTNLTAFLTPPGQVITPANQAEINQAADGTATSKYYIETPASIACLYGVTKDDRPDCIPAKAKTLATGGSHVIALVDAYNAPHIKDYLAEFSRAFGLPQAELDIEPGGTALPTIVDSGWELETCLDVEWAHALAPNAKLILVEATSDAYVDLLAAEDKASELVAAAGGGEVSNSWGSPEFDGEQDLSTESHFTKLKNIIYFAASGDTPGVSYPSASPNVVAVGGTTIQRSQTGAYVNEIPWTNEGAGPSSFEKPVPNFQKDIKDLKATRGVVDIVAIADAATGGVWVYDPDYVPAQQNKGWVGIGGTSAATPIIAALVNNSGSLQVSTSAELQKMYGWLGRPEFPNFFKGIDSGQCGPGGERSAHQGWSFCGGIGAPRSPEGF